MDSQAWGECFSSLLLQLICPTQVALLFRVSRTENKWSQLLRLVQSLVSELGLRYRDYTQTVWHCQPFTKLDGPHLGHRTHTPGSINKVRSLMRPEPRRSGHNWCRHFNVSGWFLVLSLALVDARTHSHILYLQLAVISNEVEFFPTFETTK